MGGYGAGIQVRGSNKFHHPARIPGQARNDKQKKDEKNLPSLRVIETLEKILFCFSPYRGTGKAL